MLIFVLFGQFHHVLWLLDWGCNLVRFVDANKWLLLSRDSAAASRFVICQDCWQEISLCRLSEATNSDAHMTWPSFMEIAHFNMIDMIWTQCMIFLFVIVFGQKFQKVENEENRFFAITSSKLTRTWYCKKHLLRNHIFHNYRFL